MAINKNHEFEELDGVKCGIVEKNVSRARAAFLKDLLEVNRFEVKVIPSPAAKAAAPAAGIESENVASPELISAPETFTVGVTDYTFNPINAIFGRLLKTRDGKVVTLAYWQQQEEQSHDEIPYFGTGTG